MYILMRLSGASSSMPKIAPHEAFGAFKQVGNKAVRGPLGFTHHPQIWNHVNNLKRDKFALHIVT